MRFLRGLLNRLAFAALLAASVSGVASAANVVVEGNHRVDAETIRTYLAGADQGNDNQAVKDLFSTGLFSDVRIEHRGGTTIVHVVENGVINRVAFEGNSKVKGDQLEAQIQSKSRGPFSPNVAQADVQRIVEIYRNSGRGNAKVTYRTVDLPNGRVDVVFTIDEGDKTGVKSIEFVGNHAFGSGKLRGLMQTTESNFLSFIKTSDVYDPEKIATDEDLIRRFYLRNGYADFRIIDTDVKFDGQGGGYNIRITVEEGAQYTVGAVTVESRLREVSGPELQKFVRVGPGDVYNGDQVEKSTEAITREVTRRGFAFSEVKPRGDRDPSTHKVTLAFVVDEGPRVYIERINIRGNTRTRDYVIRREFDIGEGDPYNKVLIDRAERRLNSLGFFKKVKITNEQGSSPDRIIINVDVEDQPTGSFSISGGYSTSDGFIAEVAVTESNFLGRGQFVKLAVQEGEYARGVDFSFTEPYILDTRIAAGFDLFAKQSDNSQYSVYSTFVTGGTLRLGIPITDEFSIAPHYSIFNTNLQIPNTRSQPYNDCTSTGGTAVPGVTPTDDPTNPVGAPTTANNCLANGEASLAIKQARGATLTNLVGFNLTYNTLDNLKNPTAGLYIDIRTDFGFDTTTSANANSINDANFFIRNTGDLRYYHPIYDDIIGFIHLQGGNIQALDGKGLRITDLFQLGPTLVRGFAPGGIGPRDIGDLNALAFNGLGGAHYAGASAEVQFPIYGLPRDIGVKGALFADAGTLFGYSGQQTFFGATTVGQCPYSGNVVNGQVVTALTQPNYVCLRDSNTIRSSVGASLLWASPVGPLRFDYAVALTKDRYDQTQAFRFSGGTQF